MSGKSDFDMPGEWESWHKPQEDSCLKRTLITSLLGITLISLTGSAQAGQTLNAGDRGWYDYTGIHFVNNQNYWVGWDTQYAYRDWFLFDIPDIPGLYTTATLRLFNPGPISTGQATAGYNSNDPTETFELRSFSGSIATLVNGTGGITAYNQLGSGTVFATRTVSNADDDSYLNITLNSSAMSAINAAQGGQFVIAGRLSTVAAGLTEEVMFSYSSLPPLGNQPQHSQLLLDGGATTAPEPGTLALLTLGVTGFAVRRRK